MSATINATTTSGLVLGPDNSGSIQLQNNGNTKLTVDSTGTYGHLIQGTALAYNWNGLTTNTYLDFTGIPAWVKRITVMFSNISTNGTSNYQVQIGAGSVATSGYLSGSTQGITGVASATGFPVVQSPSATFNYSGQMIITSLGSLAWVASSSCSIMSPNTGTTTAGNGSITLGGTLDRVRITTVGSPATDYFDAGSVNILYEG